MKSKIQVALTVAGMMLAFAGGRVLAAECSYHQPECTYKVSGCVPTQNTCGLHGGGICFMEYGTCCPGGGSDYSTFCGPGCDGSGGQPCAN